MNSTCSSAVVLVRRILLFWLLTLAVVNSAPSGSAIRFDNRKLLQADGLVDDEDFVAANELGDPLTDGDETVDGSGSGEGPEDGESQPEEGGNGPIDVINPDEELSPSEGGDGDLEVAIDPEEPDVNPGEPTDPEGPVDPDPEEPTDPEGSVDPDPEETIDPEGPVDPDTEGPVDPNPEEPTDPELPAEPEEPTDPEGPVDPEPEEPTDPEGPVDPNTDSSEGSLDPVDPNPSEQSSEPSTEEPSVNPDPEEPPSSKPEEPEANKPQEDTYVSIRVCGKEFFCLEESRGPCAPNQILVSRKESESSSTEEINLPCNHLAGYPWKGCVPAKQANRNLMTRPPTQGSCVINVAAQQDPCSGYPPNYKLHPAKRTCQPVSPITGKWVIDGCGEDQELVRVGPVMRWCRCKNRRHLPFVGDNRCHHTHTKGPCKEGEWLEPTEKDQHRLHCRPSPCPDKADGRHYYWDGSLYGPAGCYRSFTDGPCPKGSTFIVDDYLRGIARCHAFWPFNSPPQP